MVLYVFVVAYIGGSDEPLRPEGGAAGAPSARCSPWRSAIELCIAIIGSGLEARGHARRRHRP